MSQSCLARSNTHTQKEKERKRVLYNFEGQLHFTYGSAVKKSMHFSIWWDMVSLPAPSHKLCALRHVINLFEPAFHCKIGIIVPFMPSEH